MQKPGGYKWIKISETVDAIHFEENGLLELEIEGKTICLGFHGNLLTACSARCPHAGGRLSEGYWDAAGNLVCPLHRYKFNPSSGRNTSGEGYYLKNFPVEIRDEGVFVGFKENNLLNWLK